MLVLYRVAAICAIAIGIACIGFALLVVVNIVTGQIEELILATTFATTAFALGVSTVAVALRALHRLEV